MKVSLNVKFLEGPYGGGMQFANSLKQFLTDQGDVVTNTLEDDDIDIILHIAPLPFQEICSYSYIDAALYQSKHPKTAIILRVNECDERKETHFMNQSLIQAGNYVDGVVFISTWLKELFENQGFRKNIPSRVIFNGADTSIFNMAGKKKWHAGEKMKVVTHHWGGNLMKGHDIYILLDKLLTEDETISSKFEFTFIGNLPENVQYAHTNIIPPLSGKELGEELKKHHVYVTATRNEPAGMHHIEGALCGLPLLFLNSGALPEYCQKFGIMFQKEEFRESLLKIYSTYDEYFERIPLYSNTAREMSRQFREFLTEVKTAVEKRQKSPYSSWQKRIYLWCISIFYFPLLRVQVILETLIKKFYGKISSPSS